MTYFTICLWCCILLVRINISWILKNLGLVETMHWYCLTHLALLRLDTDTVWLTWPCWDYTLTLFDSPSHVETRHWHSLTDLAMLRLHIDTVWLTLPCWDYTLTQFDSPCHVESLLYSLLLLGDSVLVRHVVFLQTSNSLTILCLQLGNQLILISQLTTHFLHICKHRIRSVSNN